MHETGIAASILEIAEREALRYGAAAITSVCVRVGDFSNVVPEALQFSFDALKADTSAARAVLEIIRVPVKARCPVCSEEVTPEGGVILWCPRCGSPLEVLSGTELDVVSIDLEDSEVSCNASQ